MNNTIKKSNTYFSDEEIATLFQMQNAYRDLVLTFEEVHTDESRIIPVYVKGFRNYVKDYDQNFGLVNVVDSKGKELWITIFPNHWEMVSRAFYAGIYNKVIITVYFDSGLWHFGEKDDPADQAVYERYAKFYLND